MPVRFGALSGQPWSLPPGLDCAQEGSDRESDVAPRAVRGSRREGFMARALRRSTRGMIGLAGSSTDPAPVVDLDVHLGQPRGFGDAPRARVGTLGVVDPAD